MESPTEPGARTAPALEPGAPLPPALRPDVLPPLPPPTRVLLCPPDHFAVVDVKNAFMEGQAGAVDPALARRQWDDLVNALRDLGLAVHLLAPTPGCEDQVFCANQTLVAPPAADRPARAVPSRMRHASRAREVPAFRAFFEEQGYALVDAVPEGACFEGGGDVLWHPSRRLLLAGHGGGRSDPAAHHAVAEALGIPAVLLELVDPRFYHLDTCLLPVDDARVCVFPGALSAPSLDRLAELFDEVIPVDEAEALDFALNTAVFPGRGAVGPREGGAVERACAAAGLPFTRVETTEFQKSGGSVFCMVKAFW